MRLLVIRLDEEGAQACIQLWQREHRLRWSRTRRCVAWLAAKKELVDGLEEPLDLAAAPRLASD
jgi:hypothetical protein